MEIRKVINGSFAELNDDFESYLQTYAENENLMKKIIKQLDPRFAVVEGEDTFVTFVHKNNGIAVVSFDLMLSKIRIDVNSIQNGKETYEVDLKVQNFGNISAWFKTLAK